MYNNSTITTGFISPSADSLASVCFLTPSLTSKTLSRAILLLSSDEMVFNA